MNNDNWIAAANCQTALLDGVHLVKQEDGSELICGVIARNQDGTFDGYINYDEFNQRNPVAKNLQQWRSVTVLDVI